MKLANAFKVLPALSLVALFTACASTPSPDASGKNSAAAMSDPLQAYFWDLTSAYDQAGQASPSLKTSKTSAPRLQFEEGRLSIRNLCNTLGAAYSVKNTAIEIERPISTMMACSDTALMSLERHLAAQLPTAQGFDLKDGTPPRLIVHFKDGSRWEMTGSPTPQTQYGSAGERLFLEVGPQKLPCTHGVMKDAQCLQVREIRYASNGVKEYTGPWQRFYGEIEGYTHEPGIRNVLRLTRYKRQQAPADASAFAYVLDLTVETERVK